ncbi:MAG: hypothetical protein CMQ19_11460 [Gammaproteobacteria bacterium]|nr:hypothetical protein [Gammaproteobacteria bacterium]|tara:strand:- start:318 stop:998 length:681 start_codon:yes stop_codon:yes gene_type:complete
MPEEEQNEVSQVVARSQLYQSFATAFSTPGDEFLDSLTAGEFVDVLFQAGEQLPYPSPFANLFTNNDPMPREMNRQEIQVFYSSFFESGGQAVSLRELAYSSVTEKSLLEELFRFYQHFGLNFSNGELRELPDNLAIELEFMYYLTFLETEAMSMDSNNTNIQALQSAQRDFINLHPGKWVQSFLTRLQSVQENSAYLDLAKLLVHFLESEQRFLSDSGKMLIATG